MPVDKQELVVIILIIMLITELFVIAKREKEPRCLSTDEWITNVAGPYSRILSYHKKKGSFDKCYKMDEL